MIDGKHLVAIDADKATIRTRAGKHLSIYRNAVDAREGRLLWDKPAK